VPQEARSAEGWGERKTMSYMGRSGDNPYELRVMSMKVTEQKKMTGSSASYRLSSVLAVF